jgi:hypothetical protein
MTTQTVHIHTFDYGASLSSATLRNIADDTLVATADTVNEVTADSGVYAAVFDESSLIASGEYRLRAVVGGQPINRYVTLGGTNNEVVQARSERLAVLDSSVGAQITGIKAKTDNLPSDPADQSLIIEATNAVMARLGAPDGASMSADISSIKTDTGTTLPAQISGISGGSGSGARTVTITVNDGTTVLQNALIRLTEGANTFTATTNVSGVATFNVDDATYTVAITKSGYSYAGTTLVVDGTETRTYSMTVVSITPPDNPDISAIVVTCLGTDFETQSGVTIDLRIITLPSGSTNAAYPGLKQTATSNGSGIATLYAPKGSVCEWKRGKEDSWTQITIGSGDQTNVTSIIGSRY